MKLINRRQAREIIARYRPNGKPPAERTMDRYILFGGCPATKAENRWWFTDTAVAAWASRTFGNDFRRQLS